MLRTLVISGLLAVLATGAASAQRQTIDEVIAVVEDDAVFKSELEQMLKQLTIASGKTSLTAAEEEELRTRALYELINSKLVVAKANSLGIEASFTEVEKRVDMAIEENKKTLGSQAAFERQLAREGLTVDELRNLYREQIRNRMLVDQVLATEIDRGSLQTTEAELRAAYETRKNELPMRPAVVHLRTIFIAMESSESARSAAIAKLDEIKRRIDEGEDFGALAKEFSQDPSAESGGNLGTLKISDLSEKEFADAASSLDIGEVSDPVQTSFGYHLIQVTGKTPGTDEVTLRHILIRIAPQEQDIQTVFNRANKVHEQLVNGAAFDELAKQYSDDKSTAETGGDLGWLRIENLPSFFQDVLRDMKPGDISPVLREPNGFRIVELLEQENARPYEFSEVRDDLKKLVEQEKMASVYDTYMKSLRDEFYVDVRIN